MRVICGCGKGHFLSDPSDEVVCDRCGQRVRAGASPSGTAGGRAPRKSPLRGHTAVRSVHHDDDEFPAIKLRPPRISTRVKLFIASERGSRKGLGCLIALLVAAGGVYAADRFMNPPGPLVCGHEGRDSYLFGMVPGGHECEGMRALRYLDRARRAVAGSDRPVGNFRAAMDLPGVGNPPDGCPYAFSILDGSFLAADPDEAHADLPHYLLQTDGTVRRQEGREATLDSPRTGSFER